MVNDRALDSVVYAPIDGYILERTAKVGEMVVPLSSFHAQFAAAARVALRRHPVVLVKAVAEVLQATTPPRRLTLAAGVGVRRRSTARTPAVRPANTAAARHPSPRAAFAIPSLKDPRISLEIAERQEAIRPFGGVDAEE